MWSSRSMNRPESWKRNVFFVSFQSWFSGDSIINNWLSTNWGKFCKRKFKKEREASVFKHFVQFLVFRSLQCQQNSLTWPGESNGSAIRADEYQSQRNCSGDHKNKLQFGSMHLSLLMTKYKKKKKKKKKKLVTTLDNFDLLKWS